MTVQLPPMDVDEVRLLVNMLINVYEHSIRNADTLVLILNDCCPDWKHHHPKYVDDPGVIEHAKPRVETLRKMSEAVLDGSATQSMLLELSATLLKKPN
jgi:hypothetical protein